HALRVERAGRRGEAARLGGLTQPGALFRVAHMLVIVADGAAVDLAQALDGLPGGAAPRGDRAADQARGQRVERRHRDAVEPGLQRWVADGLHAERIELRAQVPELAYGLR